MKLSSLSLSLSTGGPPAALVTQLDKEVDANRSATFAASTKTTYGSHRRAYIKFCLAIGIPQVLAITSAGMVLI